MTITYAGRLSAGMLILSASLGAAAQGRLERDGVVLYYGLVPEAIVSQQHAISELHGGRPSGGGRINHLVLAVFDAASGRRIDDAVIQAQLTEPGIGAAAPKFVPGMPVNGVGSYGQLFSMVRDGPYRFRVLVRVHDDRNEVEFNFNTASQLEDQSGGLDR